MRTAEEEGRHRQVRPPDAVQHRRSGRGSGGRAGLDPQGASRYQTHGWHCIFVYVLLCYIILSYIWLYDIIVNYIIFHYVILYYIILCCLGLVPDSEATCICG